jgi:purine-cytosine permease-like protein
MPVKLADNTQMEDFSLRYTPAGFRTWSPWMVFLTCLAGLSAMAGYALDAAFVNEFGFGNSLLGFAVAAVLTLPLTMTIALAIARRHIDIDLLTRGSGFGYLGSTVTSLVYATYTLIFLAYEGAIMAQAVSAFTHLDLHISYVIVSVIMVPLTIYGMSFTTKFQAWTWPLWVALIGIAVVTAATAPHAGTNTIHPHTGLSAGAAAVTALAVLTIAAAQLAFGAQIGEQGDYLRLMPDPTENGRRRWWLAVIFGGPGLSLFLVVIFFASTLLVGYAESQTSPAQAAVPVSLFTTVYQRLTGNHTSALALAVILVLLSQMKINIMNTYSGSLSWSNFFSRVLHRHPGRAAWVFFQVGIALVLMEINIFAHIVDILAWYANVGIAWIAAMASDLIINRKLLKVAPDHVEFHRAHLYHVNPVGFGSMVIAGATAMVAYYSVFGATAKDMSPFFALGLAIVLPPLFALATRGRYYLARRSELPEGAESLDCSVCGGNFDVIDMASCPFHTGYICSLCCSTEAKCHDQCKPSSWRPPRGPVPITLLTSSPTRVTEEVSP